MRLTAAQVLASTSVVAAYNSSEETLEFAFEVVRHGARAPLIDGFLDGFTGKGLLTPTGMRERYILGRFARDRYTK